MVGEVYRGIEAPVNLAHENFRHHPMLYIYILAQKYLPGLQKLFIFSFIFSMAPDKTYPFTSVQIRIMRRAGKLPLRGSSQNYQLQIHSQLN